MKLLTYAFVGLLLGGCVSVQREAFTWPVRVVSEDLKGVAGAGVTFVVKRGDGRADRFGPATTDHDGRCLIAVPEQRYPVFSKAWRNQDFWFEIVHEGRVAVERQFSGFDGGFVIQIGAKKEPNQPLEATPGQRPSSEPSSTSGAPQL